MLFTNFIIFDLEFNSTKLESSNKSLNEIIEIGAVKLNESLQETDSFSSFIKPVISKKLNHYVKNLTHISEAELQKAEDNYSSNQSQKAKTEEEIASEAEETDPVELAKTYIAEGLSVNEAAKKAAKETNTKKSEI